MTGVFDAPRISRLLAHLGALTCVAAAPVGAWWPHQPGFLGSLAAVLAAVVVATAGFALLLVAATIAAILAARGHGATRAIAAAFACWAIVIATGLWFGTGVLIVFQGDARMHDAATFLLLSFALMVPAIAARAVILWLLNHRSGLPWPGWLTVLGGLGPVAFGVAIAVTANVIINR